MAAPKQIVARKTDLPTLVGLSYATAARLERAGKFPKRRQIADGSVGWLMSDLEAWAQSLPIANGGLRGEKSEAGDATAR
jgi:predicted DNA-binding transcriptional regulator AlpA